MDIQEYKGRKYKDLRSNTVYTVYKVDGKQNILHLVSASGSTTTEQLNEDMVYNWERIH